MLDDYPVQIKAAYLKMCSDGTASVNLRKPTPYSLQKECIVVYRRKNRLIDRDIIKTFLEIKEEDNLELAIRRAGLNKFRAIQNFLVKEVPSPRYETIEFIAWLIDFKLESNDQAETNGENDFTSAESSSDSKEAGTTNDDVNPEEASADEKEKEETKQDVLEGNGKKTTDQKEENQSNESKIYSDRDVDQDNNGKTNIDKTSTKRRWIIVATILTVISGVAAAYWFLEGAATNNTKIQGALAISDCMYWTGDHYEVIACNEKSSHIRNKIPFDAVEKTYLKKITRPDTLTENDLGKVWYFKTNGSLELFTAKGRYPLDTNRILKPLSQYMYITYMPKIKKMASLEQRLTTGNIALAAVSGAGGILLIIVVVRSKKKKKQAVALS